MFSNLIDREKNSIPRTRAITKGILFIVSMRFFRTPRTLKKRNNGSLFACFKKGGGARVSVLVPGIMYLYLVKPWGYQLRGC